MGGFEQILLPTTICYVAMNLPPIVQEIHCYYLRGGQTVYDATKQDEFGATYKWFQSDMTCYARRYLDRPTTDAARCYFAYLDWSGSVWDKNLYFWRRNLAREDGDVMKQQPLIYGPFRFNWKKAHNKQWFKGNDAAGLKMPMWGPGGEERARKQFKTANEKSGLRYWHYQRRTLNRLTKELKEVEAERKEATAV